MILLLARFVQYHTAQPGPTTDLYTHRCTRTRWLTSTRLPRNTLYSPNIWKRGYMMRNMRTRPTSILESASLTAPTAAERMGEGGKRTSIARIDWRARKFYGKPLRTDRIETSVSTASVGNEFTRQCCKNGFHILIYFSLVFRDSFPCPSKVAFSPRHTVHTLANFSAMLLV